jgi:predicted permease
VAFDGRLALVALAGALLVGLLLAAPIAWFNIRGHLAYALQSETRLGTASRAAHRLRHMFVVAQTALALVLLAGAGLLGLSLERAMAVSPGFRADHVLSGQISLPGSNYHSLADALAFNTRLMNELGRPGVIAAGIATNVPLSGNSGKSAAVVIGYVMPPGASLRAIYSYGVDGDYFAAMGFSLREGRFLTPADSRRTERVCVVDDDFARYYWPNRSALGQRLFEGGQAGPDAEAFTIVGVVGAVKQAGLTDDSAQGSVYYPFAYRGDDHLYVVARTAASPDSLSRTLQATVRRIDPDLPITNLRSMDTRIADSLITRRSPALLAGIFSAIALLLTAIGTYGVLSYAVAQRRREIGIRIALGASTGQIRAQFFSLALRLLAVGTLLGVTGAWLTGRAMRSLLYHVPPFDWLTLTAAAAILGVVSLIACVLPSHRAAKVSAVEALAEQ